MEDICKSIKFADEEAKILQYWKDIDAFKQSMRLSEGKPEYTFYDGPPFATGLPHYGHLLAGTMKDIVTRYAHQTGHYVSRRFGWDCHGLPVEYEIDKELGITDRHQVLEMGIRAYNAACRGIVMKYTKEWQISVNQLGRWIDFENDYKTMEWWYMESVWWVFKTIYDKGLVYPSFKVMPYSTACGTPLSNFEAGLNYKENCPDPAIVVSFPLLDEENMNLVIWTTTPWTLPSNIAICVNPLFNYSLVRDVASGKRYILLQDRLSEIYPQMKAKSWNASKANGLYCIESSSILGSSLIGKRYEPLFDYFVPTFGATAFIIVGDSYVSASDGTGLVHQAPGFGEDDYRVCKAHNLLQKADDVPCPVSSNGKFTEPVIDYLGRYVKDCDDDLCAVIKSRGRLLAKGEIRHSYPYCWRSDTPLIYKAVRSWFVNVESIKSRLIECNNQTYWVPAFVKEKRFHNWLEGAKDWSVSRNRFWGTPLPIWSSDDGLEVVCIGSLDELEALSGQRPTDLHRENVDHITIPSKQGKGVLRRIDEVFDCWFESGAMPYAQLHYPFENRDRFEGGFPADFIAEGLDQTRGWFYTLMVLSTALFDKPAFKNLIANGLVLASDGKKMSKRLKNYPDPSLIMTKYGADSLRLYLINSPVVRAEPLKFKESGVFDISKDVLLPWFNSLVFYCDCVKRYELGCADDDDDDDTNTSRRRRRRVFKPNIQLSSTSTNDLDVWIQSSLNSFIKAIHTEMKAYRLYNITQALTKFLDLLSKWYVRLNRSRLKGIGCDVNDTLTGLSVLHNVLMQLAIITAPFTPFFSEYLYQKLRVLEVQYGDSSAPLDAIGRADSVHYLMLPDYSESSSVQSNELCMNVLMTIVDACRVIRERKRISLKTPVRQVIVACRDPIVALAVNRLRGYLAAETNGLDVVATDRVEDYCQLTVVAREAVLGQRLKKRFRKFSTRIASMTAHEIASLMSDKSIKLTCDDADEEVVTIADVVVSSVFIGNVNKFDCESSQCRCDQFEMSEMVHHEEGDDDDATPAVAVASFEVLVIVNIESDQEIESLTLAREFISAVQRLRKTSHLVQEDMVNVFYESLSSDNQNNSLASSLSRHEESVVQVIRCKPLDKSRYYDVSFGEIGRVVVELGTLSFSLLLARPAVWLLGSNRYNQVLLRAINMMDHKAIKDEARLSVDGNQFHLKCGVDYMVQASQLPSDY